MKKGPGPKFHFSLKLICISLIFVFQIPAISLAYDFRQLPFFAGPTLHQASSSLFTVFPNSTPISIADRAGAATPNGISTPYPSSILVSGMTGTVSDVNVTINGLTTARERDLNFALVSPTGQTLMLMGDAGDLFGTTSVNLTFDDSAAAVVPSTAITTGTYRPTDYLFSGTDSDDFPAPGPGTVTNSAPEGAATLASAFNGIAPNGNWHLYIVDDALGGGASTVSGGWSIDVTTAGGAAATTTTVSSNVNPALTGQTITFTSSTTSGSTVNTGTVSFTDNTVAIAGCSNVPVNASGSATCMTTRPEGRHTITATYNGTASFATSNGSMTQVVNSPTVVNGLQFCNNGGFSIADAGASTVFPSNITVSGLVGVVTSLSVQLNGMNVPRTSNLDFLLVGPGGQAIQIISDTGDSVTAVNPLTLNISDAAASQLPNGTPIVSGTYRPTDINAGAPDTYPAPAPGVFTQAAPSGAATLASTFVATNPNGNWALYAVDDSVGGGATAVTGWCVTFAIPTAAGVSVSGRVRSADGRGIRNATVMITNSQGISRRVMTTAFGGYQFDDLEVGQTYVVTVMSRRYQFTPRVLTITEDLSDVDFVAEPTTTRGE